MTTKEDYPDNEEKIQELLDKDFLERLLLIARLYGWQADYYEIINFIEDLYNLKGMEIGETGTL